MSEPGTSERPVTDAPPSAPLTTLLEVLTLRDVPSDQAHHGDDATFEGASLHQPTGRVYGGQVLAQSLLAAARTVEPDRLPHSLHGYFLRAGDVTESITFGVEQLRDGRSFSARRTHAYQSALPILSMITSFQRTQPGIDYADPMPAAPGPQEVASALDSLAAIDHPMVAFWSRQSAFDIRHVEGSIYLGAETARQHRQLVWMRSCGHVDGDQLLHRALLAYACDQIMLEPVLRGSGNSWSTPGLSLASLDHAMWWHRDVRVDEWLLYVEDSPSAQGGRGLTTARVFAQDGTLVATIAQEGMVRVPEAIEA